MNELPAENILEETPPPVDNYPKRIKFFAKALASGAEQDKWTPKFSVAFNEKGEEKWRAFGHNTYNKKLNDYLVSKWSYQHPQMSFLEAFGYTRQISSTNRNQEPFSWQYILTPKAIDLLSTPLEEPDVFISYKRDEGTALALLVLARLQARGIENPYIDMQLEGGEKWREALQRKVEASNTFICILSPESLQSDNILEEIAWASTNEKMKCIFLSRDDWSNDRQYPEMSLKDIYLNAPDITLEGFIRTYNWIEITGVKAKDYNSAMVQLLNDMGYAPR